MTLSTSAGLAFYEAPSIAKTVATAFDDVAKANGAALAAFKTQLEEQGSGRNYLLLGVIVVLLHGIVAVAYVNRDTTSLIQPPKHQVEIEFIKPEIVPPKPIEPPKPPPPPKVQKLAPPPPQPQPTPSLRTQPAEQNIAPSDLTVAENTHAAKTTGPVAEGPSVAPAPPAPPVAASAPPAPKVEEPVTEATANAAYLNNPKPDYPAVAARQGWGGTVTLRVRVLADGHAESVEVKKSSGRKVLDESAIAAVKQWTFVPSKRGSTPIDGWATVPIVFNPEQ